MGTLIGGDTVSSSMFQYKIDIQSNDLAIVGAKPIDSEKNGFNGAVLIYKNKIGFFETSTIVCKSAVVGADGTARINLPVVNTSGRLGGASNWKVVEVSNNERSDRDLIKLIKIKTIDEIGVILHKQKLIYLDRGVFPDKYHGISRKESRFFPEFNVKVRYYEDSAIVVVQPESSEQEKYKTYFGFIKITKFDKIRPLTEDNTGKYIQASFLCTSDRSATPLPNNKTLDRVRDRCPNGYTKSPVKT